MSRFGLQAPNYANGQQFIQGMPGRVAGLFGGGRKKTRDPLLTAADKKIQAADEIRNGENKQLRVVRTSFLTIVPTIFFIVTVLTVSTVWAHSIIKVFGYLAGQIVVCAVFFMSAGRSPDLRWRIDLAKIALAFIFFGFLEGLYIFYQHEIYYYAYKDMPTYTNIAASQPPSQFSDAGVIMFSADTAIDVTRAVGYKAADSQGKTLCVAPIVDSTMGLTDPISFFAIGEDCCPMRGDFFCDDAKDGSTRTGWLMLDPASIANPALQGVLTSLRSDLERSGYDKAIEMQHAAFSTIPAEGNRLLRWTKDPEKHMEKYNDDATEVFVLASIAAFLTALAIAVGRLTGVLVFSKDRMLYSKQAVRGYFGTEDA